GKPVLQGDFVRGPIDGENDVVGAVRTRDGYIRGRDVGTEDESVAAGRAEPVGVIDDDVVAVAPAKEVVVVDVVAAEDVLRAAVARNRARARRLDEHARVPQRAVAKLHLLHLVDRAREPVLQRDLVRGAVDRQYQVRGTARMQ